MVKHFFKGNRIFRPCHVSFKVDADTLRCLDFFAENILFDTRSTAVSKLLDSSLSCDCFVRRFYNLLETLPPKRSRNCFYTVNAVVSIETFDALCSRLDTVREGFDNVSFNSVCYLSLKSAMFYYF